MALLLGIELAVFSFGVASIFRPVNYERILQELSADATAIVQFHRKVAEQTHSSIFASDSSLDSFVTAYQKLRKMIDVDGKQSIFLQLKQHKVKRLLKLVAKYKAACQTVMLMEHQRYDTASL